MPRLQTPTDLQVLAMTHPSCWLPLRSQRRHRHLLLVYGAKLPLGTVNSLRPTCISVYASSLPFLLAASLALPLRSSRDLSVYSSGLADSYATLDPFCWLDFERPGSSPGWEAPRFARRTNASSPTGWAKRKRGSHARRGRPACSVQRLVRF